MRRASLRRCQILALGACLVAASARAAEPEIGDIAAAEALFREGRARLAVGNVDEACAKFQESERLDPSSGTLVNLAACHEKQGKFATAWAEFLAAERLAATQGKRKRAAEAERKAAALAGRVSYLTIAVAQSLPGMEVRRDDVLLEGGSIGAPLPVDPGAHRVVVAAPGYEQQTQDVTIGAESDLRTLTIPELVPVSVPVVETAMPVASAPIAEPTPPPPVRDRVVERRLVKDRTLGWVVGGAGAAFAATGGVLFLLALSANDKAEDACRAGNYGCDPEALTNGAKRDTFATLATVSGAIGLVGIGAGVWLLLSPREHIYTVQASRPRPVRVGFVGSSLVVRGAFE